MSTYGDGHHSASLCSCWGFTPFALNFTASFRATGSFFKQWKVNPHKVIPHHASCVSRGRKNFYSKDGNALEQAAQGIDESLFKEVFKKLFTNIWSVGVKWMGADSYRWHAAIERTRGNGQEPEHRKFHTNTKINLFMSVTEHWKGCPARLWSLLTFSLYRSYFISVMYLLMFSSD